MRRDEDDRVYWDSLSEGYDRFYVHSFSQQEDSVVRSWITEAVGTRVRPRVLDIGCGTGFGFTLLTQVASEFSYVGIDLSDHMISRFRSKVCNMAPNVDVELMVRDARNLEQLFPERSFDLIVLFNATASYVGGSTELLQKARRLLSGGGILFASYLNRHALRRLIRRECGIVETYNTRGASEDLKGVSALTISRRELCNRCARSGLNIRWIKYQSVLGGVWETNLSTPIEAVAMRIASSLGHTINLLAEKPGGA